MSILGDNLKRLRQEHAPPLTQSEVAEKLGILPHNYTPFETGGKVPGNETLEKLAAIYNAPLEKLIEWKEADVIAKKYKPQAIEQANKVVTGAAGAKGGGKAGASPTVIPPLGIMDIVKSLPADKLVDAVVEKFGLSKEVIWALIKQEEERNRK